MIFNNVTQRFELVEKSVPKLKAVHSTNNKPKVYNKGVLNALRINVNDITKSNFKVRFYFLKT